MRRGLLSAAEYKALRRAFGFLLRVRNDLHFQTNRPTDVLDLENQPSVADASRVRGRDEEERVEAFMREVYKSFRAIDTLSKTARKRMGVRLPKDVLATMRQLGSRVPRNRKYEIDGFCAYRGEISAVRRGVFKRKPARILRLFQYCQAYGARRATPLKSSSKTPASSSTMPTVPTPKTGGGFSPYSNSGAAFSPRLK